MDNINHVKIGVAAAAFAAGATAVVSKNKKEAHKREVSKEATREYTTLMVTMKPSLVL